MDFGLSRFDVAQRTQRLQLPEISADPATPLTLILTQVAAKNSRYTNWLITHAAPDPDSIPAEGTPARVDYDRGRTAETVGASLVAGWENVSADGGPVPYTPEHGVEFMRQVLRDAPYVFNRIWSFVLMPSNWQDPAAAPPTDPVDLGKG